MLKIKKAQPLFTEDELLDLNISNETLKKVILNGEYVYLETLSKNQIFKELDPELILSMSKMEIENIWFKKTKNQLTFCFIFLFFGFFIFKFYDFINAIISLYLFFLYFIKQRKDIIKENKLEQERQQYIINLFENHTELKKLNLSFSFEEFHIHKP